MLASGGCIRAKAVQEHSPSGRSRTLKADRLSPPPRWFHRLSLNYRFLHLSRCGLIEVVEKLLRDFVRDVGTGSLELGPAAFLRGRPNHVAIQPFSITAWEQDSVIVPAWDLALRLRQGAQRRSAPKV